MSGREMPDRANAVPVFRQLYVRYRDAISSGQLKPGDRVPSVRALASELNLARGTVEAAYQLLIGEGYLETRGPAGTIVCPQLSTPTSSVPPAPPAPAAYNGIHTGRAPLPLQMGLPALDAFPRKTWTRLASRVIQQGGLDGMIYPNPQGDEALRVALTRYLAISRGIACTPDQVFICAGYRACLELISRSVLKAGDRGWFEDPGYFLARRFFEETHTRLVPVPVDEQGLCVDLGIERAPDARFAVVTPSHQSPLGVSLSLPRRQALLAWASDQRSWIIEDDYDSEYRYVGRPLPALKSLDTQGRVLYTGTFSKVLIPGLRLAYLVVPNEQVAHFARMADALQNHCPQLLQRTTATFIEEGHFARHLKRMRSLYAHRRTLLSDALTARLGERMQLELRAGGMHVLAGLADGLEDSAIAARASRAGLALQALSDWYQDAPARQGLLMGFTNVKDADSAADIAERIAGLLD
ncbi:MocR-like pyridoxine biosynthesis transcription factor PdxR [Stutzerimonas nitrititolerans]|uniref:MocR-like pyridoxine biosynthesis transcription factor PdxR n=1 Tax=Stutzerimonas nitrititolerans TaxID=2482751 RepID=UPI00289C88B7|nr:PLP-dependent aminotransferase family protein [Stutzerimonas nitrititolerans]